MIKVIRPYFYYCFLALVIFLSLFSDARSQEADGLWHGKERTIHYKPSGNDFVLYQGAKKFNRALYGSNTGFRVETGDMPEFALYLPGMGGNCRIALSVLGISKWLTDANRIKAIYKPGNMLYEITDPLIKNGKIFLTVRANYDREGMIVEIKGQNIPFGTELKIVYGGVTGKKFSRDGDIGADPESSFYLKPEYCKGNEISIEKNVFTLSYGANKNNISGIFPVDASLKIIDAKNAQTSVPTSISQNKINAPALMASFQFSGNTEKYFLIQKEKTNVAYAGLSTIFVQTGTAIKNISNRVILQTPDEYVNPLGGALAMATDAIWEEPTFLHGAVAWRMRLPAWRGAFAADPLGWHDRARLHFDSYLQSQVINLPPGAVVADTALHIARQQEKMGNSMFSNGYICRNPNGDIRPHHYDMNLGFVDQMLNHFNYAGDTEYVKKVWPSVKLHLQWEKRNFDADDDGLYDAYACIWASDALQYSGGGVTHSTAYNYRANKIAAQLAKLIGADGTVYQKEAEKILAAMNNKLWLHDKGTFAEYKDLGGLQRTHDAPGLWTIYHAIDGGTATPQQQSQMLRYIDHHIPHIPVNAKGLPEDGNFLLSTTNWQPYTWSVNNVALAENLHTSLAYWQGGESDNAFKLWKSALVESMYLGSSPGSFQQLSFYDAVRGELYRDFADPVGIAARTLTEGLFGILPDALNNKLLIKPGFPSQWKFAKLSVPDISIDFKQSENKSIYTINQRYSKTLQLSLVIPVTKEKIGAITVNGKSANYQWIENSFGRPMISIDAGVIKNAVIVITNIGNDFIRPKQNYKLVEGTTTEISFNKANIIAVEDPQHGFDNIRAVNTSIKLTPRKTGQYSVFATLKQGNATWIQPFHIDVEPAVEIVSAKTESPSALEFSAQNNSNLNRTGVIQLNDFKSDIKLKPSEKINISINSQFAQKGTNKVKISWSDATMTEQEIINWQLPASNKKYEPVDLSIHFNENVTNIFKNKYLSPRPSTVTLQIPWQGIGNWCYPLIQPEITDAGIKNKKEIFFDKIPFQISNTEKNICFTSLWDNYPDSVTIPLSGNASHAYFLMAGTTNHQQSQMENAVIMVKYTDGSSDHLQLINPKNWWPIEQDLMNDGFAFNTGAPKPYRFILKTGEITRQFSDYSVIKGFSNNGIEGGAGTLLDMPLDKTKQLKSLTLKTVANEVIAGLMSVTLVR